MRQMTSFEDGRMVYEFTDLRKLSEAGIQLLYMCLEWAIKRPKETEMVFKPVAKLSDDEIMSAFGEVASVQYRVKKKYRNGFDMDGVFLVSGLDMHHKEDGKVICKCDIIPEHAECVANIAKRHGWICGRDFLEHGIEEWMPEFAELMMEVWERRGWSFQAGGVRR